MNNEFEVGDLVSAHDDLWAPGSSIGFITELRTLIVDNDEKDQAKVMWVNGQHYWCPCYTLKCK